MVLTDTIRDLLGAKSYEQLIEDSFDRLVAKNSAIRNWNVGGYVRTMTELACHVLAELHDMAVVWASNLYTSTATGRWLDLRAADQGVVRQAAGRTKGTVIFGRASAGSSVPIAAGTVVATEPGSDGERVRFVTLADAVMAAEATTASVAVEAELPGQRGNVAPGSIVVMVSPIAGITSVTNGGEWIESAGTEEETDDELRLRCLLRWSELNYGGTADAYRAWAMAVPGVVAASCIDSHPRGPGTVDVCITGVNGLPEAGLITAVQTYIDARRPVCVDVLVRAPAELELTLAGELEIDASYDTATVLEAAEAALHALWQYDAARGSAVIGPGTEWRPALATATVMAIPGVLDVAWSQNARTEAAAGELVVLAALSLEVME